MTDFNLRSDCAQCAALCCVAFAFERSDQFALDKEAGEPCPHLDGCRGCRIHADRDRLGFGGCVLFECHGAGQRVTQSLFQGKDWRNDPALIEPMSRVFLVVLRAHESMLLLREAQSLALSPDDRERASDLMERLWQAGSDAASVAALTQETADFLSSLRKYVEDRSTRPVRSDRIR